MIQDRDKQIKDLGIDVNLTYEIGGDLDNIKVLLYFIHIELEKLESHFKRLENPFLMEIRNIIQLSYVISNEHNNCLKDLETLRLQLEGE